LVNEYQLDSLVIKHYDLYRINDEKELISLGIFEDNSNQITLIEWPEIIKNYKTNDIINLIFEYDEDYNKRFLTISSNNKISFLDEFK
jgi:tRNA threonylcarbamoyladenosine biosynthesis protein TsaE